jgi:hypothetical protein
MSFQKLLVGTAGFEPTAPTRPSLNQPTSKTYKSYKIHKSRWIYSLKYLLIDYRAI